MIILGTATCFEGDGHSQAVITGCREDDVNHSYVTKVVYTANNNIHIVSLSRRGA
jgi:hypothetical protein